MEVFARRQIFSGRIAMLPGLPGAVQGLCTGPLVALPSPAPMAVQRFYNWAVVVRHELTHAFNLLPNNAPRVPMWLTEGLAVRAENTNRFSQVNPILRDRLAASTLLRSRHHHAGVTSGSVSLWMWRSRTTRGCFTSSTS